MVIVLIMGKEKVAATNWIDDSYQINFSNYMARVSGNMNTVKLKISTPVMHIGLRIVAFLFGNKIISFLKKKMILPISTPTLNLKELSNLRM